MTGGHSTAFRTDIQGLRAVAVVLVVVGHLFAWPTGGYIGVDVFFVISGFLITGILLRQEERTGRVSLAAFYGQRARRILPAAMTVLFVVVALGAAVWQVPRATQTLLDAFAAATFVINWQLVVLGTDYLQATGPASPLQHYWSLAVEEQFYLLWPVLLGLVLLGLRRAGLTGHSRHRALLAVVLLLCAASLAWAAWRTGSAPAAAYFDSIARAWELGVGALLAVLHAGGHRGGGRFAPWWAGLGLAAVAVSAVTISPTSAFPFPWAVVPVAGTALVVWAGATRGPAHRLLSHPVALFLGDISFSLYLWHWPVAALARTVVGPGAAAQVLGLVVSVLLSVATLRWVETPFRRRRVAPARVRVDLLVGAAVTVVILAMTLLQFTGPAQVRNGTALLQTLRPTPVATLDQPAPDTAELIAEVGRAADATRWPSGMSHTLDEISQEQRPTQMRECLNRPASGRARVCTAGPADAEHTALLLGDSVAVAWAPALEDALVPRGWRVETFGLSSCPVQQVHPSWGVDGTATTCVQRREEFYALAAERDADLVVVSHAEGYLPEQAEPGSSRGWARATETMVDRLADEDNHVVLLQPPARAYDPPECLSRVRGPDRCRSTRTTRSDTYAAIVSQVAARSQGRASFIDTRPWLCTGDGRCPAFIADTYLRTDNTHLTHRGSQLLAGALADALDPTVDRLRR